MAASADQLAARLVSGGRSINRASRVGVEKACLSGKQIMLANMVAANGGRRLRSVGKSGANLNVRYRVYGYVNPVGIISYVGPVHLANNATRPHEITPRDKGRGAKKALSPSGGDWARKSVQHPGTSGKKFAERSEKVVLRNSARIVTSEVRSHLARTFT